MENKWIINFTVIIFVIGISSGLVLSGVNPWLSSAEADQLRMETAHKQKLYELAERLSIAETESELRSIELEQELLESQYAHDKLALQQDLVNRQRLADILISLAKYILLATAVVANLCVLLLATAKSFSILRTPLSQPTAVQSDTTAEIRQPAAEAKLSNTWNLTTYRKQRIQEARNMERAMLAEEHALREAELNMVYEQFLTFRIQSVCDPSSMSATEYEQLPLAE